jgi:uncharacterized membrane protein YeaQ/YmgE (transglycosylase-associated protein family)
VKIQAVLLGTAGMVLMSLLLVMLREFWRVSPGVVASLLTLATAVSGAALLVVILKLWREP